MNRKSFHLLNLISLGIILGAGGGIFLEIPQVRAAETKQNQNAEKQAIQALIQQQVKATNEENIQGIKDTYHPNSSEFSQWQPIIQKAFQIADMKVEVNKVDFIKIAGDQATVRILATARKIRGSQDIKNNRTTSLCYLQKYQGKWKFFSTEVEKIEFF